MTADSPIGADALLKNFENPAATARYLEGPRRYVPGLDSLLRMTGLLLAERAPDDARILVLGAGGGSEIKFMAELFPRWRFVGVDPAGAMLRLAERQLGSHMARVELVQGYIDDAPAGPFDAATCLLTLHFLELPERIRTVREIHRRLSTGAPFVAAHMSFPQSANERRVWLDRYAAYPVSLGGDPQEARNAREAVDANLNALSPEQDEGVLRDAGFTDVAMFFAAFTWRGWIACAK